MKTCSIGLDAFDKPEDINPASVAVVGTNFGPLRNAIAVFESNEFSVRGAFCNIGIKRWMSTMFAEDDSAGEDDDGDDD